MATMEMTSSFAEPIYAERPPTDNNTFCSPESLFIGMYPEERVAKEQHIYEKYADAISRRNREPLSESRFTSHFFQYENINPLLVCGCDKNGYVLGMELNDVFVPTHFAPESTFGGVRIVKGLLEEEQSVALFITEDLVKTLTKMPGWKVMPFKIKSTFRGEEVEKTLVINHWEALPQLAVYEVSQAVDKATTRVINEVQHAKSRVEDIINKVKNAFGVKSTNADLIDEYIQPSHVDYAPLDEIDDSDLILETQP